MTPRSSITNKPKETIVRLRLYQLDDKWAEDTIAGRLPVISTGSGFSIPTIEPFDNCTTTIIRPVVVPKSSCCSFNSRICRLRASHALKTKLKMNTNTTANTPAVIREDNIKTPPCLIDTTFSLVYSFFPREPVFLPGNTLFFLFSYLQSQPPLPIRLFTHILPAANPL